MTNLSIKFKSLIFLLWMQILPFVCLAAEGDAQAQALLQTDIARVCTQLDFTAGEEQYLQKKVPTLKAREIIDTKLGGPFSATFLVKKGRLDVQLKLDPSYKTPLDQLPAAISLDEIALDSCSSVYLITSTATSTPLAVFKPGQEEPYTCGDRYNSRLKRIYQVVFYQVKLLMEKEAIACFLNNTPHEDPSVSHAKTTLNSIFGLEEDIGRKRILIKTFEESSIRHYLGDHTASYKYLEKPTWTWDDHIKPHLSPTWKTHKIKLGPRDGVCSGEGYLREEAAFLLASILGFSDLVPPTIITTFPVITGILSGSLQSFVPDYQNIYESLLDELLEQIKYQEKRDNGFLKRALLLDDSENIDTVWKSLAAFIRENNIRAIGDYEILPAPPDILLPYVLPKIFEKNPAYRNFFVKMAIFDTIIGNLDRTCGNTSYPSMHCIDHALALADEPLTEKDKKCKLTSVYLPFIKGYCDIALSAEEITMLQKLNPHLLETIGREFCGKISPRSFALLRKRALSLKTLASQGEIVTLGDLLNKVYMVL